MSASGHFVWYDLLRPDLDGARAFYGEAVGWGGQRWGEGDNPYTMWMAGEVPVGGVMELPPEKADEWGAPRWWGYVAVDDVDAAAARAEALGGSIRTPPTDIPDVGRYAVILDRQGAELGLLQPSGDDAPPDRMRPGGVGWHELHTTDYEDAWRFYSELFGWRQTGSMDMGPAGTYVTFGHTDEPADVSLGGMFNPDAMTTGPYWLFYVNVDDAAAVVERVRNAGGNVMSGPDDVPGGRAASCMDPEGCRFAVFSPQPEG